MISGNAGMLTVERAPRRCSRRLVTPVLLAYTTAQEDQTMGDEIEAVTETAKAVQEVAKTGRALIEPGTDLARFVGKALDTVPEDAVGLLGGDYLHELRLRNLDKISRKTEEILRKRGVEEPEPIGPKALLPALEAASEESNETLQDMWAELLANAMDPNNNNILRQIFIETLKKLDLLDALVFQQLAQTLQQLQGQNYGAITPEDLVPIVNMRKTQIEMSLENLKSLNCIGGGKTRPEASYSDGIVLTALGRELYLACQSEVTD